MKDHIVGRLTTPWSACIGLKRLKTHELHVKSQKLKAESQKLKCNVELKPILTAGIHSLSSKAKAYATRPLLYITT